MGIVHGMSMVPDTIIKKSIRYMHLKVKKMGMVTTTKNLNTQNI